MPNITTCTSCGSTYEVGSEEQANEILLLNFHGRSPSQPFPVMLHEETVDESRITE